MARWPTPKVAVNDANAPAYNPDDPDRDKIGIYAEDFHDLAEVLVNKKDLNYWNSQKMTKRSVYPESVFAYEALLTEEEWNDLDNDHTNWTAGNAFTDIKTNTTVQLEGDGCLQLYAHGAAPTAYRSFTAEDWSAYKRCALSLRTNKTNEVVTVRIGANSSNYWQFKVVCPVAHRWYAFEFELNGSGYGVPPESTVGSPNIAQIGYIFAQGTTTSDAYVLLDLITLHKDTNEDRYAYDMYAFQGGVIALGDFGAGATISYEDVSASAVAGTTYYTIARYLIPAELGVTAIRFTARHRATNSSYTSYVRALVNGVQVGPELAVTGLAYMNTNSDWVTLPQGLTGLILIEIQTRANTGTSYVSTSQVFLRR